MRTGIDCALIVRPPMPVAIHAVAAMISSRQGDQLQFYRVVEPKSALAKPRGQLFGLDRLG